MPMMWILKNLGLGLRQNSSVYSGQQFINSEFSCFPGGYRLCFQPRGSSWCCSSHTSLGFLPQPSVSSPQAVALSPIVPGDPLQVSGGLSWCWPLFGALCREFCLLQASLAHPALPGPGNPRQELGAIVGHIIGFSSLRDHCLIMWVSLI